jgi:hypothetical protein
MSFKQTISAIFLFSVLSIVCLQSCRKIQDEVSIENNSATLYGRVTDESGNAIVGALVTTGTYSTNTDALGIFILNNISTNLKSTTVKVNKSGYFKGSRTMMLQRGQKHEVKIILLEKSYSQSFNSISGGTINFAEGIQLTFRQYALKTKGNGTLYSGNVTVFARRIDPTTEIGKTSMPGDLIGLPADSSSEKMLVSYGMMVAELYDDSGNELQLVDGKEAEMTLDVPASLVSGANTTIPLWYYDETKGKWIEEGSATLQAGKYVGKVKHFSFWNCDRPETAIEFEATFVDQENHPLNGYTVKLTNTQNYASANGITNSNGWVGGFIYSSATIKMEVYNYSLCGNVPLYNQTINTGNTNLNLGVITVTLPLPVTTIKGMVLDCNSTALGNSLVYLSSPFNSFVTTNSSSGAFVYSYPCATIASVGISAYNINTQEYGYQLFQITSGVVNNMGSVFACSGVKPFMKFTIRNNTSVLYDSFYYSFPNQLTYCEKSSGLFDFYSNNKLVFGGVSDSTIGVHSITKGGLPKSGIVQNVDSLIMTQGVSSTVNFTNFSSNPGDVSGSFNLNLTGSPSQISYTVTGTFRANRRN